MSSFPTKAVFIALAAAFSLGAQSGGDIPKTFKIRGAAMTVDYDFVSISGRDYLMPVRSSVTLARPHRKIERNEISFHNYRRFASRAKIKMIH